MKINFAGLKLNSPFIAASGCAGYGWEIEEYFPGLNWGAITSKTITLKKREGNPPPRIFEVQSGIINRIGLENCGLALFFKNELPKIKNLPYPVIVSIYGETLSDWKLLTLALTQEKVKAIELNFSCPNIKGKKLTEDIIRCTKVAVELKKITHLPLIAKICALDKPVELCIQLKKAGIDGIICSNTFPAMTIYEKKCYNGGLSGQAIKSVVLKTVKEIIDAVDIDVAACGGISSKKDIEDYRCAGANVFVIGSILLSEPDIINELKS